MSDHVVCPVCRSRNVPGTRLCTTCGAPLATGEPTGLPPGFPLWPVSTPTPGIGPRPGSAGPAPGWPGAASAGGPPPGWAGWSVWPGAASAGGPPPGWPSGPWTGQAGAPPPWQQGSWPPGGQPSAGWPGGPWYGWLPGAVPQSLPPDPAPPPPGGWVPISAKPRSSRAGRPGDCWNCGSPNPRNREFCRGCGQRLDSDLGVTAGSVRGAQGGGGRVRRAVAFVVSVLVVSTFVSIGVVAFGGFLPRVTDPFGPRTAASLTPATSPSVAMGATASPPASQSSTGPTARPTLGPSQTPRPTLPPVATATPVAIATADPTDAPTAPPGSPDPTQTPLPAASETPGASPGVASPKAPPPTGFDCASAVSVRDPLDRGWRLNGVYWAERDSYDRLTLRLIPEPTLDGTTSIVKVEPRPRHWASDVLGLPDPTEGDLTVIVRFSNGVMLTRDLQGAPNETALRTLTAASTSDGKVWMVLGVAGEGCRSLQAPAWDDPSLEDLAFVDVTLDLKH